MEVTQFIDMIEIGGGVVVIRDHLPFELRQNLMVNDVEVLWLQEQLLKTNTCWLLLQATKCQDRLFKCVL